MFRNEYSTQSKKLAFMISPALYTAFLGAMFLMAISPGPANIFMMRIGLSQRPALVIFGVLGLSLGTFIWFVGSGFGLSLIDKLWPPLLGLMAVAGGLYLLWMGASGLWHAIRSARKPNDHAQDVRTSLIEIPHKAFLQGLSVQLLNPKALLFFTAVLPPFLNHQQPLSGQLLIYGATTLIMDAFAFSSYGFLAVALSTALANQKARSLFDLVINGLLVVMSFGIILHSLTALRL